MRVQVQRFTDTKRWGWECWRCQAGEASGTWRRAMRDAHQHIDQHTRFGFQTGKRVTR